MKLIIVYKEIRLYFLGDIVVVLNVCTLHWQIDSSEISICSSVFSLTMNSIN